MVINIKKENDSLTISLDGYLDTLTAPQLEAEIQGKLEGISNLVFDFNKLTYISSAGLRVLLTAQKAVRNQGQMIIKNTNANVKEIFDITGFSDILNIE